jgi:hypothetical protein
MVPSKNADLSVGDTETGISLLIFKDENTSLNTSLCGSQECATKKAQKKELPEGNSLSYINLL